MLQAGIEVEMSGQIIAIPDPKDHAELRKLLDVAPQEIPKVAARAVNRAADTAKSISLRTITGILNLKRSDISQASSPGWKAHRFGTVNVHPRASEARPIAQMNITGRRIPVYRFGGRQQPIGASWQIGKGGGRKFVAGTFVATMRSGHTGIFIRHEKKGGGNASGALRVGRLPIYELLGPSLPKAAEDFPPLLRAFDIDVSEVLERRLAHEVGRVLERHG